MADNTPTDPSDWNSASTNPESAWWRAQYPTGTAICRTVGIGALAALQSVLANGLRPSWKGPDGASHSTRIKIDGNFGPDTCAAMWAYAKLIGAPASTLATIAAAFRAKKIGLPLMQAAVWLAYYQPRKIDIDEGNPPVKTQRTDVPMLGTQPIGTIAIPADAKPWVWMGRPSVPPNLPTLAEWMPGCTAATQAWDFTVPQIDITPPTAPVTAPASTPASTSVPGKLPPATAPSAAAPPGVAPKKKRSMVGFVLGALVLGAAAMSGGKKG